MLRKVPDVSAVVGIHFATPVTILRAALEVA
jgi:hypothetical protein